MNGTVPAQPTRTLETLIGTRRSAHPTRRSRPTPRCLCNGPFPIIVYVHGFGGRVRVALHALRAAGRLCRHRSVVPTLRAITCPAARPTSMWRTSWSDASFVLNQMAHLPAEDADIQQIVNGQRGRHHGRVGCAPGSRSTSATTCTPRDPRVRRRRRDLRCIVLSASSAQQASVRPAGTATPGPTSSLLMLMHGTADPTAPYAKELLEEFGLAPAPKFFVTLKGAPHIRYGPPWEAVAAESMIDFFDRYLKNDPRRVRHGWTPTRTSTVSRACKRRRPGSNSRCLTTASSDAFFQRAVGHPLGS